MFMPSFSGISADRVAALKAKGLNEDHITLFNDALYAFEKAIELKEEASLEEGKTAFVFAPGEIHRSNRFKNSPRARLDNALRWVCKVWIVAEGPIEQLQENGRKREIFVLNAEYAAVADYKAAAVIEKQWIDDLISKATIEDFPVTADSVALEEPRAEAPAVEDVPTETEQEEPQVIEQPKTEPKRDEWVQLRYFRDKPKFPRK